MLRRTQVAKPIEQTVDFLALLLQMGAAERAGLWTGAGTVFVMTLAGVWYVRRRVAAPLPRA